MEIIEYDTGAAFLERATPQLLRNEAFSGLLYGIAGRVDRLAAEDPDTPRPLLATLEAAGQVRLLAVMTPPHRVILHGARDGDDVEALQSLAAHLQGHWRVPGVLGPRPLAQAFAREWTARTGQTLRGGLGLQVYELRTVRDRGTASGRCRVATEADRQLLEDWMLGFHRDVHGREPKGQELSTVSRRLPHGDFRIWEDGGEPVSLAAKSRPTPTGMAINAVYTPPQFRRRGYATSCVAALCQEILDDGKVFCTLFADLENTTSNAIYQHIGFEPLGEFVELDVVGP